MVSLDSPEARSRKVIGTSTILSHRHRTMSSRAILNPSGLHARRPASSVDRGRQKKPDMGSVDEESGAARSVAPLETTVRRSDHSKPTPPSATFREPTAKSASPERTGRATEGMASGSCWRSASMQRRVSCLAKLKPRSTALLSPRPSALLLTCIRTAKPSLASSSTMRTDSAVAADSSSAKSTSTSSSASFAAANSRLVSSAKFPTSL
mmetsp:Transcript_6528/g.19841  ORF Transcript_6528/g.19841 Transcript_6528/m.19841 type:complete len:209 (-) Transcript_6528:56-682(-)